MLGRAGRLYASSGLYHQSYVGPSDSLDYATNTLAHVPAYMLLMRWRLVVATSAASRMSPVVPKGRRAAPQPHRARPTGQAYVRMPVSLHQKLIESAEREGVSLNQYIVATLAAAERWSSRDNAET